MTKSLERPLGAQISHMLKDRGVDTIFGIPGVHNQEMYRGIEEAGITHVLARHEQGAGFMADGYARATGGFGVCYVITGPGLCNIMTPLGQAYSDSVSVLTLASCLDDVTGRKGQLHQMKDQEGAAATVCDWSETAQDAKTAYRLIDRALADFSFGDPRPKTINVPIAALEGMAEPHGAPLRGETGQPPAPENVRFAAEQLRKAKKPLFVFGGGAKNLAVDCITPLLDRVNPATFCTFAGRGIVPLDYLLHYGPGLTRPDSARVIAEADLVLVVGSQLAEVDIWREHLGHTAKMIRVDTNQEALTTFADASYNIRADAASFVNALLAELGEGSQPSDWSAADVAKTRAKWRTEVDAEFPNILPIMDSLRDAMPDDAMIYSDMTQFAYAAKECWDMAYPGHWHHPSGFGTLGYSLPASIGGAVARKGKPTVCIIGDYGIQYTIAELGTAVELGLPLAILLWDNGKLGAIEDSMIAAQIAPNSVIQRNPDFLALARAYGAEAVEPKTLGELAPALAAAFTAKGPTIIRMTPALCQ
ncbi:thiamine pyrophosphate-dependent enzyme [Octadecabacter sp. CECT 8868]|uniref:thiamine pyrophosphate-binding protein n=1 Tax=Octadecabacter algicola TaxID=2909342 RepID=UPI001F196DC7|nr:thiamine pyrophosphate-binding protein [Octadecabacter algicola]MCF2904496.1 thiamine pyrophosphate-dependent enzyme [Octadecabacter algicola]